MTRTRGTEMLASTTATESKKEKDSFDIRNYMTRVYEREPQPTRNRNIGNNNRNNDNRKLTLADLLSHRQRQHTRTFIKSVNIDDDFLP